MNDFEIERRKLQIEREFIERELVENLDKAMERLKVIITDYEEEMAHKPTFWERMFGWRKK